LPNSGQGNTETEKDWRVHHKQLQDEMCDMFTTKDAYV